MSADYRYVFYDLITDKPYAQLPLYDARFEWTLNKAGGWQGTVPLMDRRVRMLNWREAVQETRTYVGVERNHQLLFGGIVWDTDFTDDHDVLPIKGEDIWSYFDHRALHRDVTFTQWEQLDIANWLIVAAQTDNTPPGVAGGNIGVTLVPFTPTGRLRDRTYKAFEGHYVGELLKNLSAVIDGFDFRFLIDRDPSGGAIRKRILTGYPFLGRTAAETTITLTYPGQIRNFAWPVQGSESATRTIAVSDSGLIAFATASGAIAAGVPLVDKITSYQGITDKATLQAHADADLQLYSTPLSIPPVAVEADVIFSRQLWPGDGVQLVIEHPIYFPGRRDSYDGSDYRLIAPYRIGTMKLDADHDLMEVELISTGTATARAELLQLPGLSDTAPALVEVS